MMPVVVLYSPKMEEGEVEEEGEREENLAACIRVHGGVRRCCNLQRPSSLIFEENQQVGDTNRKVEKPTGEADTTAQRVAEWGLVLKTNSETGKSQGVTVRTSGDDDANNRGSGTYRRDSGTSVRTSDELSDDGASKERAFPRVSEDLKDALSTFQQTSVVSDATKPNHPIMYASAGTGTTSSTFSPCFH
uniref:Uncharacterized protein n=1 Tax=Nelumbo nucifera TaxID=4432 RepID=A0A822YTP5_NELNU|nr:TPA_asm: hypothetical protein HUJ06_006123 [Nelumbo nucifera]